MWLLDIIGGCARFQVQPPMMSSSYTYLDQREAAVRARVISTMEIDLRDGRRFQFRSSPCRDDGRILTYVDITPLKHERDL